MHHIFDWILWCERKTKSSSSESLQPDPRDVKSKFLLLLLVWYNIRVCGFAQAPPVLHMGVYRSRSFRLKYLKIHFQVHLQPL